MIGYIRTFKPNEKGHGGEKRTAQLNEILFRNWEVTDVELFNFEYNASVRAKLKRTIKGFPLSQQIIKASGYKFGLVQYLKEVYKISTSLENLEKQEREISKLNLIIWENTAAYLWFVPLLFKICYKKVVIACPHNLESLVPGQEKSLFNSKPKKWWDYESDFLKKCKFVFTISYEESWLLSLWGIQAYWLPYFPTSFVEKELLDIRGIRKKRKFENSQKDFFLILGTAANPPTRKGFEDLVRYIEATRELDAFNFVIAGYGTEKIFKNTISNIQIRGTVSNEELENLFEETRGIIINQYPTSGQLCKIMELLLAGVPIICNHHASRSYLAFDINVFNRLEELPILIKYVLEKNILPAIPTKPAIHEKNFCDLINLELVSSSN